LPSYGLAARYAGKGRPGRHLDRLEARLRALPRPVIGRIADDALWLDLRCLEARDAPAFGEQLAAMAGAGGESA
jgi:L-seryl-tRNA(Ser) seleniumtransferase